MKSAMARRALFPQLSDRQKNLLLFITKRRGSAQHLVRRAQIVLFAAEFQTDPQIAPRVGLCERTVRTWSACSSGISPCVLLVLTVFMEIVIFRFSLQVLVF